MTARVAGAQRGGGVAVGGAVSGGTSPRVLWVGSGGVLDDDAGFTFDEANQRVLADGGLGFVVDTDTFISRTGTDQISVTTAGARSFDFTSGGNFVVNGAASGKVLAGPGTSGLASLGFGGDADTGFYSKSANVMGVIAAGAEVGTFSAAGLSMLPDTDAVTILGRARFDSRSTDRVVLSHFDLTGANDYALFQTATGDTFLNAKAGQTLTIAVNSGNRIRANNTGIGFFATAPVAQQTATGSRGGNAALASLLTALATSGLIVDSTTA